MILNKNTGYKNWEDVKMKERKNKGHIWDIKTYDH